MSADCDTVFTRTARFLTYSNCTRMMKPVVFRLRIHNSARANANIAGGSGFLVEDTVLGSNFDVLILHFRRCLHMGERIFHVVIGFTADGIAWLLTVPSLSSPVPPPRPDNAPFNWLMLAASLSAIPFARFVILLLLKFASAEKLAGPMMLTDVPTSSSKPLR